MASQQSTLEPSRVRQTIRKWLESRISEKDLETLKQARESLQKEAEDWEVFSSFSKASRITGKEKADLSADEIKEAGGLRRGWDPSGWTLDQLGRTYLVLSFAERGKEEFFEKLEKLFISGDLSETVALYQALPVLPWPDELTDRGAEGIRTNITSVFNAVALKNPYPADYFDDDAWNQVILKSLFVGSPLYKIQGVDRRANKPLAQMLVEYAHERWSAGREVSPELWRPAGPFIGEEFVDDLEKVINHPDKIQQYAAVLALKASDSEAAKNLLTDQTQLVNDVSEKNITWVLIGKSFEKQKQSG